MMSKESIEPCLSLKLRQADRLLKNRYDAHLSQHGITITQFSILRMLWYYQKLSQKQLEEKLILQQTTLTRNLKPLLRDGVLTKETSSKDARVSLVSLTDTGKTLFSEAEASWAEVQLEMSQKLGDETRQALLSIVEEIIEKT